MEDFASITEFANCLFMWQLSLSFKLFIFSLHRRPKYLLSAHSEALHNIGFEADSAPALYLEQFPDAKVVSQMAWQIQSAAIA